MVDAVSWLRTHKPARYKFVAISVTSLFVIKVYDNRKYKTRLDEYLPVIQRNYAIGLSF